MNWETVNPAVVVPARLCAACASIRAARASRPGKSEPSSYQEALDFYDAIEWIAQAAVVLRQRRHARHLLSRRLASGASPICSRRRSRRSCRGKAAPISIATRRTTAASSRWASSPTGRHATRRTTCSAGRAATTPMRSTTTCCGSTCATISIPSTGACAARDWDKITVPVYSVGNWGGLRHAPARQHRGLHVRRLEAQEAAHPHRHAFPSLPLGGRAHGPAALVRPLAEGHRHRHHGRAAGEARDPHRRQHEARTSSATRTSGRSRARSGPRCTCKAERERAAIRTAVEGRARREPAAGQTSATYPASGRPMPASPRRRHRARTAPSAAPASRSRPAPMREDTEITGPLVLSCGCRARRRTWTSSSRCATSARTARTCARSASTAEPVPRDQGLAARLAPQARPEAIAAVPAVSCARRAPVAQARRDRRVPGRDLADLDGVPQGPPHAPRRAAARRRRQPRSIATIHADYNIGARNTIYAGGDKQSYLLLPIIPPK